VGSRPRTASPLAKQPDPAPPLLLQRNFASLWWGQLISILGERLTYLALVGLLAVHTRSFREANSSYLLATLANVMLAPVLLFAPFTGAWVDRLNLRRVLVISDLTRSLLVFLIPAAYLVTHSTLPMFVIVFLMFMCNVFFLPAKSAITPEIVPPGQLLGANALLALAGIIATAVGALGGGWFIDHFGWSTALVVNGVTYLVSVAALLRILYTPHERTEALPRVTLRSYLQDVREGWGLVRGNPTVGLALTALGAVWIGGGFLHVAGNLHVQRAASAPGMERVGALLASLGVGSGLSTWWLNTHGRRFPRPALLGVGLVITGIGIGVFALSTRFAVFAAAAFAIGIAAAPAFMLTETLLQEATEARTRGRVFSARDFLMRLVFLVGVTVAGWATRTVGVPAALLTCATIVAGTGLLSLAWSSRVPREHRYPSVE
jgi:MFS family permease